MTAIKQEKTGHHETILVTERVVTCPPIGDSVTFEHPRVTLDVSNNTQRCPYCGLEYQRITNE
jgi:uncharacterized Zn-finger protein